MSGVDNLVGGSILAFWGLALGVAGLAMTAMGPACTRGYRSGTPLLSKCGYTLAAVGMVVMLAGFHVMGSA